MASVDFHLTDAGNAEFFADQFGDGLRFDHRRQRWLEWREHRWAPIEQAAVLVRAKEAARRRLAEAASIENQNERTDHARWALQSESRTRLDNVVHLARAESPISDPGNAWDSNPWLLGVANGVVDLQTGVLRDGRDDDHVTMQTAVAYRPHAPCDRWERFLADVFAPHPDLVPFVQRAVGYSLTGQTTEQVLFLLHGKGANGKSTFLDALRSALGDYAFNMPFSTVELQDRSAIPHDLAALVGRRFVMSSETNDGTRLNEARIKALTGCDPITARELYKPLFEFRPVAKFWLSVNHRPVVKDDSHGFWRRIRLVPFERTFGVDTALAPALQAEAAGILRWAVEGCLMWQRDGLEVPTVVAAATNSYRLEFDPLHDFLTEACDVAPHLQVQAKDLYAHYKRFAEGQGLNDRERMSSTLFGRRMADRFKREHDARGCRVYVGVGRRDPEGSSANPQNPQAAANAESNTESFCAATESFSTIPEIFPTEPSHKRFQEMTPNPQEPQDDGLF